MTTFALALLATTIGAVTIDLGPSRLVLDDTGRVASLTTGGRELAVPGRHLVRVTTSAGERVPERVERVGDQVVFTLAGGGRVAFQVATGDGYAVWRLAGPPEIGGATVQAIDLADLAVTDELTTLARQLNAAYNAESAVAVMPLAVNVRATLAGRGASGSNQQGCRHTFERVTDQVKSGAAAARYQATSDRADRAGWTLRAATLSRVHDLQGLRAIKAWVHGDGGGQALKFQLQDSLGGPRDHYVTIDFTGWREVTISEAALDRCDLTKVARLNLYYNGLPANRTVTCGIDAVRAVVAGPDGEREVMLEEFDDAHATWWDSTGNRLTAWVGEKYGLSPAGFALVVCPRARLEATIDACQAAAGLPNPRPGGVWGKQSPWAHRSYLFLTNAGAKDVEDVIVWAQRGGFPMLLVGGGSWNASHGQYAVNETMYPGGLDGLKTAFDRYRAAGLRVGLHFLAASVYPNDPYLTPRPDPRLVTGAEAELAADVDAQADFIPTTAAPSGFPTEDGGYRGTGLVLRIGDELVAYTGLSTTAPFGFTGCRRGHHRTVATAHARGAAVRHLRRSYGYFLFDLDSTLADEVVGNVAKVANHVAADYLYFDGSEALQGDHWYYNAKLQDKYYRAMADRDILFQGSSYSAYSWHLISRMASADGHGDVKGYLDERTGGFQWYQANLMPIDIGWYYVYDPDVTADQYDYILQRCLGFDATISVQTSPQRLRDHPEAPAIFDLCRTYEQLRLSGLVPADVKARLREPKREYRLLRDPLRLRRTVFGEWQPFERLDGRQNHFTVEPAAPGARLGLQLRCRGLGRPGANHQAGTVLETFDDLRLYLKDPAAELAGLVVGQDQTGSTSSGVTHELALVQDGPDGGRCARYTATSNRADDGGWSSVGKRFPAALDLTAHQGIGFWLKGDGQGGKFKLQLRDAAGGATDYYVTNDFSTWRYQQLPRPEGPSPLPIDYRKITHLLFYYNGLPAKKTVTCLIDEVRALPGLDEARIVNPALVVGDQRVTFTGTLTPGERLVWFPGEAAATIIPRLRTLGERRAAPASGTSRLDATSTVQVVAAEPWSAVAEARLVQDLPEELPLPEAAAQTPLPPLPK